eukprot:5740405-Prymnesium_polylepis.2
MGFRHRSPNQRIPSNIIEGLMCDEGSVLRMPDEIAGWSLGPGFLELLPAAGYHVTGRSRTAQAAKL